MSGIQDEAANTRMPMSGGVAILTITNTMTRYAIPTALAGRFCTFTMSTIDADLCAGTSSVTCTYNVGSTVSSEAITIVPGSGGRLIAGIPRWWRMPRSDEAGYFAVDGAAAGPGYLVIELSTP